MLISPNGFDCGAEFELVAETEAERILLKACEDSDVLTESEEDVFKFVLNLPVSN